MLFRSTWDDERGMMIMEWGGEPEFYTWLDQPTFRTVKLSQLIDDADNLLKPKQHLRVNLDIDISFEEASFIKENFITNYNLRELTLISERKRVELSDEFDGQVFESVDQIITNQLVSIQSDKYNTNTLLDIYNNL